jgi:ribosomal protein S2
MLKDTKTTNNNNVENMFSVGAHFAFSKSRRHPTIAPYIFGTKNKVEIFDLEKTSNLLDKAKNFIKEIFL